MKTNILGIHADIPNDDYHSAYRSYLSFSAMKELDRSAAHYLAYCQAMRAPTAAMKFGTGFHELVGEPTLFAKKYAKAPRKEDYADALFTVEDLKKKCEALGIKPGKNKGETTKLILAADPKAVIWDDVMAKFEAANMAKTILEAEEFDHLDGMLGSLIKNKTVLALLSNGKAEQSIFWKDPETGVLCRCRPDYLRNDGIVVDLKTAEDASAKGFQRAAASYRYDLQSAHYLDGVASVTGERTNQFIHIVVEKKPPYAVGIYTIDDEWIEAAREDVKRLRATYAACTTANEWPAYSPVIEPISRPAYMR